MGSSCCELRSASFLFLACVFAVASVFGVVVVVVSVGLDLSRAGLGLAFCSRAEFFLWLVPGAFIYI
jgi:hypothetical protein